MGNIVILQFSNKVFAPLSSAFVSRITKYICSSSTPNLLSVLESYRFCPLIGPFLRKLEKSSMSLAKWVPSHFSRASLSSGIAAASQRTRKQSSLLTNTKATRLESGGFCIVRCDPTENRTPASRMKTLCPNH